MNSITTQITWHKGGAQRGDDGHPVPWPEAWADWSPEISYQWFGESYVTTRCKIHKRHWEDIVCWCDPVELDPPTFDAKGDADAIE